MQGTTVGRGEDQCVNALAERASLVGADKFLVGRNQDAKNFRIRSNRKARSTRKSTGKNACR